MTEWGHFRPDELGIVVIGRNEGPRLEACLQSLPQAGVTVVYVDSGSTDNSVDTARSAGAIVVELDRSRPFTAARARNVGWRRLCERQPSLRFIQFVDGDCTLAAGWLSAGVESLKRHPDVVAVCGRLREQHPEASVFNLLCHIEWDGPPGEIDEFGGIVMLRHDALQQVGGYVETVIAAEDTELGARLRQAGGRLARVDVEMAKHDAHMHHLWQWWKRAFRSGHAHAEMNHLHGAPPICCRTHQCRSNWLWGLLLPITALALAQPSGGGSLLLLLAYPLQYVRILMRCARRYPLRGAHWYALFCVLGKFPETLGQLKFWLNRLRGRQTTLIEYKGAAPKREPVRA